MKPTILIGADPEFWLKKDGKFVSAHGIVEGTKENPQKLTDGAVQVDGMALEVNINPAPTAEKFMANLRSVFSEVRKLVPEEYEFDFSPTAHFGKKYIEEQPQEARELGCQPDYSAYTMQLNETPDASRPFRTAAGHIHIGWCKDTDVENEVHMQACVDITKELDRTIGIMSVIWDKDKKRRELYGQPGAFRPKSYGVEYRVLSNFWLKDPEVAEAIINMTLAVVNRSMNSYLHKFNHVFGIGHTGSMDQTRDRRDIIYKWRSILPSVGLLSKKWLEENMDYFPLAGFNVSKRPKVIAWSEAVLGIVDREKACRASTNFGKAWSVSPRLREVPPPVGTGSRGRGRFIPIETRLQELVQQPAPPFNEQADPPVFLDDEVIVDEFDEELGVQEG